MSTSKNIALWIPACLGIVHKSRDAKISVEPPPSWRFLCFECVRFWFWTWCGYGRRRWSIWRTRKSGRKSRGRGGNLRAVSTRRPWRAISRKSPLSSTAGSTEGKPSAVAAFATYAPPKASKHHDFFEAFHFNRKNKWWSLDFIFGISKLNLPTLIIFIKIKNIICTPSGTVSFFNAKSFNVFMLLVGGPRCNST